MFAQLSFWLAESVRVADVLVVKALVAGVVGAGMVDKVVVGAVVSMETVEAMFLSADFVDFLVVAVFNLSVDVVSGTFPVRACGAGIGNKTWQ